MTRKFVEAITGIYTGSAMRLGITQIKDQQCGHIAEEHTANDNTVWVTKTHFPLLMNEISF